MSTTPDTAKLETEYSNACTLLKNISDNAQKTYVKAYNDQTGEWSNIYSYSVPYNVIREARDFIERVINGDAKP